MSLKMLRPAFAELPVMSSKKSGNYGSTLVVRAGIVCMLGDANVDVRTLSRVLRVPARYRYLSRAVLANNPRALGSPPLDSLGVARGSAHDCTYAEPVHGFQLLFCSPQK